VEQTQVLQLRIVTLEDRIETLHRERDVLNNRIAVAEQKVEELQTESEFFKKKLFEAEQYIVHLDEIRDSAEHQVNMSVNEVSSESVND
jgi:chromosome segregation ATPase